LDSTKLYITNPLNNLSYPIILNVIYSQKEDYNLFIRSQLKTIIMNNISTHLHGFQKERIENLINALVNSTNGGFNVNPHLNNRGFWELVFDKDITEPKELVKIGEFIGHFNIS